MRSEKVEPGYLLFQRGSIQAPVVPDRAGGRETDAVKKIPPDRRRRRTDYKKERSPFRRVFLRLKDDHGFLRSWIQASFAMLCIWIGVEFYLFVQWGASGGAAAYVSRPPGSEGFLPISALMSLSYWVQSGVINEVHPSALFIFLAILGVSWVARKGFCSWLCPIGTLSESLWAFGQKMFGRNISLPRWLDYPLRSLKYLLLFFFVWSIAPMSEAALRLFIYSPYNKVADIKMFYFFAELTEFAFWTLVILIGLSVVIKNFWCRFLCPYGALLGIVGWFSPLKITRVKSSCIDCELCTKACPSVINVHRIGSQFSKRPVGRVWSDECTSCLSCVDACPVKDTLHVGLGPQGRRVPGWAVGVLIAGVFMAITGTAILSGKWQNQISKEEYLYRFPRLGSYQHFHGSVPDYGPND